MIHLAVLLRGCEVRAECQMTWWQSLYWTWTFLGGWGQFKIVAVPVLGFAAALYGDWYRHREGYVLASRRGGNRIWRTGRYYVHGEPIVRYEDEAGCCDAVLVTTGFTCPRYWRVRRAAFREIRAAHAAIGAGGCA